MQCDGCGFRQKIFSGTSTKEDFCKWLITETHKGFTVIAHNARGYDAYFLYDYLMMNGSRPDPVIFSGSKIIYMHINSLNMRLLDSLNFLPMPLANLPKSFGLKEKKKKKKTFTVMNVKYKIVFIRIRYSEYRISLSCLVSYYFIYFICKSISISFQ